jgi:5-methylcytosine-specific restriction enzyme B
VEKVLQYLLEFKPEAKAWFEEQKQVAEDYAFFKEFSKRETLEKAEWPDIQKIGDHLNCFRSMGIAKGNALGRPNHSIGDSGRCRSVFRGMPITRSGMMAITIPG